MSIIRAIKHRLGLSVTPANNFVLDASADNGTMKLARESGQDIMTVDAAGNVALAKLIQSLSGGFKFPDNTVQTTAGTQNLSAGGLAKLPNGLILQWGAALAGAAGAATVSYQSPFPNGVFCILTGIQNVNASAVSHAEPANLSTFRLSARTFSNTFSAELCYWFAIGY